MQSNQNVHFIRATTRCPCATDGPVLIRVYNEQGVVYGIGIYKFSMADLAASKNDMHLFSINGRDMTFYAHELEYLLLNDIGSEQ